MWTHIDKVIYGGIDRERRIIPNLQAFITILCTNTLGGIVFNTFNAWMRINWLEFTPLHAKKRQNSPPYMPKTSNNPEFCRCYRVKEILKHFMLLARSVFIEYINTGYLYIDFGPIVKSYSIEVLSSSSCSCFSLFFAPSYICV